MQAFSLLGTTGPAALHLTDLPIPAISAGDVLVRVRAISLNPVDYKSTYGGGAYRFIKDSPIVLGWDISGTVEQVGADVTQFRVGDDVFGMVNFPGHGRAYAAYVAAPAAQLAHKPAHVSHAEAAAATLAALTAWQGLLTHADVQPGQRVLIHAAAGGVGHYAVQLAKERGAYVIGTSSGAKRELVLSLGADEHVDYTQVRFEEAVPPVDLVLEMVGGDTPARSLAVLKPGGLLLSILGPLKPDPAAIAQAKGIRSVDFLVSSNGADQAAIADRLADGRLRSHVAQTFPFAQLPRALQLVETGRTQGKIIVLAE